MSEIEPLVRTDLPSSIRFVQCTEILRALGYVKGGTIAALEKREGRELYISVLGAEVNGEHIELGLRYGAGDTWFSDDPGNITQRVAKARAAFDEAEVAIKNGNPSVLLLEIGRALIPPGEAKAQTQLRHRASRLMAMALGVVDTN